jgi:hypothetical protein
LPDDCLHWHEAGHDDEEGPKDLLYLPALPGRPDRRIRLVQEFPAIRLSI